MSTIEEYKYYDKFDWEDYDIEKMKLMPYKIMVDRANFFILVIANSKTANEMKDRFRKMTKIL